jgi:hypothetical protein
LFVSIRSFGQNDGIVSSLKKKFNLTEYDNPTERIEFSKDTILIAGYLGDGTGSIKNIIYKTTDGGLNWKKIRFSGNAWIYDSHHDKEGNVWMGGSDNYIHYSSDFGDTWQRKLEPFIPINRVHAIFMVNSKFGIAGGLHNGLALTLDNWNSVKQIPTPLDQKKFKILPNSSRDKIERVGIVDSVVIINQNDHVYFSKLKTIQWTEFNIPVIDFSVDLLNEEIILQSRNGKFFVLSPQLNLVRTYQEDFTWEPIKDDSLSLATDDFFRTKIKSFNVKSINWVYDKPGHMVAIYKPISQEAIYIEKAGVFQLKSRKHSDIKFTATELTNAFNTEKINLSIGKVGQILTFTDLDIKDYKECFVKEEQKRKEEKDWGGDFTSLIPLENNLFTTIDSVLRKDNSKYILSIYNHLNYPITFRNSQTEKIELVLVNAKNDTLKISNENSLLFSLPWTIQLGGQSTRSFNPEITKFVRSILPTDFVNYQMLLGGQLIFELVQEQIIKELEYKNGR